MKKYVVLFIILLASVSFAGEDFNKTDGYLEFNGMKWKASIKEFKEFEFFGALPDNAGLTYSNPNEKMKTFMGFPVIVLYNFYTNKFDSVTVRFKDYSPKDLREKLLTKYGEPSYQDLYGTIWDFKVTKVMWSHAYSFILIINKDLLEEYQNSRK